MLYYWKKRKWCNNLDLLPKDKTLINSKEDKNKNTHTKKDFYLKWCALVQKARKKTPILRRISLKISKFICTPVSKYKIKYSK